MKMISERLHNASMLLLVHIYLQWTSLIELLAKKESGLSTVNKIQMYQKSIRFFFVNKILLLILGKVLLNDYVIHYYLVQQQFLQHQKCFVMELIHKFMIRFSLFLF
jgi:hypothetical protein